MSNNKIFKIIFFKLRRQNNNWKKIMNFNYIHSLNNLEIRRNHINKIKMILPYLKINKQN